MSRFPLLRLPFLPQMEILKHMNSKDLYFLSLISKRSKNLVRFSNRSIENVTVTFSEVEMLIKVGDDIWTIVEKKGSDGNRHEMENRVLRHLFSVFRDVQKINVALNERNVISNSLWNYTKCIENIIIENNIREMSKEEVNFALEELKVSDIFCIRSSTIRGFHYREGITHDVAVIEMPRFNHLNAVINSTSSDVQLHGQLPPASEVNRLLKAWISCERLETLVTFRAENRKRPDKKVPRGYIEKVFKDIPVYGTHPNGTLFLIRRIDGKEAMAGFNNAVFVFSPH